MTVEFVLEKCDALVTLSNKLIPFDDPVSSKDWLKEALDRDELKSVTVTLDGEKIGLVTYCVVQHKSCLERELVIVTAAIQSKKLSFIPLLVTFAEKIAKQEDCGFIRFHTVRKGLIKQTIACGFYVSEIVLRKPLK